MLKFRQFLAALIFYTRLPISVSGELPFAGVAHVAPCVGILIGSGLGLFLLVLARIGFPSLVQSSLVVSVWVWLTGGLHLDGVMDTADGLAASQDLDRRLAVMTDSTIGAFGVMAGVIVVLLKVTALASIRFHPELALVLAAGWGRWGQLVAIARYPYLKPTGKGAFHKTSVLSYRSTVVNGGLLVAVTVLAGIATPETLLLGKMLILTLAGGMLAWAVGAWFHRQLGGHTGDTYGATVEWTEALFLCLWSGLIP